jgi:hypothetical protein
LAAQRYEVLVYFGSIFQMDCSANDHYVLPDPSIDGHVAPERDNVAVQIPTNNNIAGDAYDGSLGLLFRKIDGAKIGFFVFG